MSITTLELQSLITPHGELRLTLEEVRVPVPGPDEMVVRVDAAPIYPSDVGDLLGPRGPHNSEQQRTRGTTRHHGKGSIPIDIARRNADGQVRVGRQ